MENTSSQESIITLNGNMAARVVLSTQTMEWQSSPSGTVWRKRLHLVGTAEAGQVTSIVRYDQNAQFPIHDHPNGEEILVLDGVFSDEHGDWPKGTYLLNPEGFRHAPFSKPGCLLFVKLRQYSGNQRHHVALQTEDMPWMESTTPGIQIKTLYAETNFPDQTYLELWDAGSSSNKRSYEGGAEIFVLEGVLEDENGKYDKLTWLRMPPGSSHAPVSQNGCQLYVKTGALPDLRSHD